jgi:hypothetical protein
MLTAAMVAASTPAAAADPMGPLLDQIQRAQDRKQFKRAAELAAPASQRTDLRPADRFVLARSRRRELRRRLPTRRRTSATPPRSGVPVRAAGGAARGDRAGR